MNANTSSPNVNREYLARRHDPADVAEATAVFTADHAMHTVTPTGKLVVANNNARPSWSCSSTPRPRRSMSRVKSSAIPTQRRRLGRRGAPHRGVTVHVVIGNSSPADVDRARQELRRQGRGDRADLGQRHGRPIRTFTRRRSSSTASPPRARAASSARRIFRPARSATTASSASRPPTPRGRAREGRVGDRHRLRERQGAVALAEISERRDPAAPRLRPCR